MPADYPAKWVRIAATRDDAPYRIRPLCAEDAQLERAFILGLSPDSRYARMMYAMNEPSTDLVNRFVQIDYHNTMAFAALIGQDDLECIIGVARYAANVEEGCEFAVAIADAWQGRGIAATLSRWLFDYARVEGIRSLQARILASNHRMIELARWLGMSIHSTPGDGTVLKASIAL
jgi:acetyltransferase